MRRFLSAIIAISIVSSLILSFGTFSAFAYNLQNVSEYSQQEVETANLLGFISQSQSYADLSAPITRLDAAELAVIIFKRLTGTNAPATDTNQFTDTKDENANLAAELKLMSGKGDGLFAPDDYLTRQEMSKVFINILTACKTLIPKIKTDEILSVFEDADQTADWAKDSLALLVKNNIIKGDGGFVSPLASLTKEQAFIMAGRFYNAFAVASKKTTFAKPQIAIPTDYSAIKKSDLVVSIGWTNETVADKYVVYVYNESDENESFDMRFETTNTFMQINTTDLTAGNMYAIRIGACYDGISEVFSDAIVFKYGESWNPVITNKDEIASTTDFESGITLTWESRNEKPDCIITVAENGEAVSDITVTDTNTYTFADLKSGSEYSFTLYGINDDGTKTEASDSVSITVPEEVAPPTPEVVVTSEPEPTEEPVDANIWADMTHDEKVNYIFPEGVPFSTEEEAKRNITTIIVPVWRLNSDGTKTSSTMSLDVHHRLAEVVYTIFAEIFNSEEQVPFADGGAYSWRDELVGGKSLSHHCYGTAIDLNYNSNYCIYPSGSIVGDHWLPGEDVYSFPADGIVVKTFKKYGFYWGGDWHSTKDYMHFSFLEE